MRLHVISKGNEKYCLLLAVAYILAFFPALCNVLHNDIALGAVFPEAGFKGVIIGVIVSIVFVI